MAATFKFQPNLTINNPYTKRILKLIAIPAIVSLIIIACNDTKNADNYLVANSSVTDKSLNIWWDKGFSPEEDEALRQLVSNWEKETGNKINLIFYTTDSLGQKIRRSLKAGNPADIIMSFKAERSPNARLAWDNKLVDVSDIINLVQNLYTKPILETVNFYNNALKKRSYYAVPIHQGTMHIYYRRDLLEEAGRSEKDIPKEWDNFWEFWEQVQDELQSKNQANNKSKVYSLGFTLSPEAGDTYYLFEQILEAHDIEIVSPEEKLLIDEKKVRQGIIKVLKWYQSFYDQGYIPPTALRWLNPGNNRSILNREIVITPNSTASIPAAVRQDPDIYNNKLGILKYPNKPNGESMRHLTMAEQAVVLTASKNHKLAKDFLKYLVQTEVKKDYLTKTGGRNSPVMKPVWKDSFWTNPNDPHISYATNTFTEGRIRDFYISQNPAYS